MLDRDSFENRVRNILAEFFDRAEAFVENMRPVLHGAVDDLRGPVVSLVTTTVDGALELRERGENLAATVSRDAKAVRKQTGDFVKRFVRTVP